MQNITGESSEPTLTNQQKKNAAVPSIKERGRPADRSLLEPTRSPECTGGRVRQIREEEIPGTYDAKSRSSR